MHVIWDWNGTLFRDLDVVVAASAVALATVGAAPVTPADYRRRFRRPVRAFHDDLVGREITDQEWRRLDDSFHLAYADRLAHAELAPDAEQALAAVDAAGWSQSLLSMWRHEELMTLLPRWPGLADRFRRVDGDLSRSGEGKAANLRAHLAELELNAAEVALIGDTVDDAVAAHAVGARVVLVTEGSCHTAEALAAVAPTASTLAEAVDRLRHSSAEKANENHNVSLGEKTSTVR